MNEERRGAAPHCATVHHRHHEARSGTPDDAAGRGSAWASPFLTTVLAGPSILLLLGATRLFSSGTVVAAQPLSRERAPHNIEGADDGDHGGLAPPSPPEVAEREAIGDPDGGSDEEDPTEVERLGEGEAGGVVVDTVPAPDGRDRSERRKRRQRGTDEEGEDGDPFAGLGPMVRHLAVMTKELSEAQRTVGRLTAERDLLRQQLGDDPVIPIGSADAGGARPNKEARMAAKRVNGGEPVPTPEELAAMAEAAGRRRRLIAGGLLLALVAAFWIGWLMEVPLGEYLSKGGLTTIPGFGPAFQILIVSFLLFRVVKVGGKAGSWLFPSAEEPKRRRR